MLHLPRAAAVLVLLLSTGCTLHSTATYWNGRVGPEGKPVFVKSSTNVGFNLLIVIPLLGRTSMHEMVDTTSSSIDEAGGDHLRVIETGSENYWYGFPPFTWIMTPVITDIAIEYEPTLEELVTVLADDPVQRDRAVKRFEESHRPPTEQQPPPR